MKHTPIQKIFPDASWIWKSIESTPDDYAKFYVPFVFEEEKVTLRLSCHTNYECYVNGKLASYNQYADYPYDKIYEEADLTPYCHKGENRMTILVWYYGLDCFTHYLDTPGLIFSVCDEKGKVLAKSCEDTLCCTPNDYICGRKKSITPQMGYSYTYDASGIENCFAPDFSGKGWQKAALLQGKAQEFRPRPIEKFTTYPLKKAQCIDEKRHIFDLKAETVGYLGIRFQVPSGAKMTVSWGEHLVKDEGGNWVVPRIIGARDFSVEFFGNGEWFTFSNFLRRIGARYFQATCDEPFEIGEIGLSPAEYPVTVLPFDAKNELRQKIYDISVHTLRCCMYEHYEDCPWREQSLYNVDSRNQMLFGYAAFQEYRFPRASLELFGMDRRDDDLLHICVPSVSDLVIPFFSLFWLVQMKEYADASGDTTLICDYKEKMEALLSFFLKRMQNGLIPNPEKERIYWNFYEWNGDWDGAIRHHDAPYFDVMLNCTVSLALTSYADMLEKIGEKGEKWRETAKKLNKKIHDAFYVSSTGLMKNTLDGEKYSVLGNTFAILCGAVSEKEAEKICEEMLNNHTLTPATLSMHCFFYDALLKTDEEKYREIVLARIDSVYKKMLDAGATSFWETELGEADFHNAGSLCHGWSAAPIYYYRKLLK